MTDHSSAPENASSSTVLGVNTHRIEAVNDVDASTRRRRSGGPDDAHPTPTARAFDFRLTGSDAPTATATVLELFTGYLVAASHACSDPLDERVEVTRVVVDGTVSTDADTSPTTQSALTSVSATLSVETTATDALLERWRRTLRDAEATQEAVPTDVMVSLSVVRSPRRPTA